MRRASLCPQLVARVTTVVATPVTPWAPGLTQGAFSLEDDLYRRPGASAHAESMWGGKTFHNGKWAGLGQERGSALHRPIWSWGMISKVPVLKL